MSADARVRLFHGATIVALLAALAGLTIFVGCGRGVATKPIADAPAGPGGSAVVAGTVSANGSGVADAIVTLEPIVNGRTATVSRLLRAGAEARTSGTTRGPLPAASDLRVAATDAKGRYAFAGVPAGSYVLTAKGTNYLGGSKTTTVSNAAAVETTFVNLALTPTGTFSGSFWLETMTNHSGIVAYIAGTSNVAVTNAAGDFVMRDVPVGAHIVTGSRPGFLDASLSATIAAAGDSVNPGGTTLYRDRNIAPTATAFTGGNCTTGISFVGTGNDADGSIAIYEWDFDDDGEIDYYSTTTGVTMEALDPGNYRARFTVTDNKGAIASAVVQVFVSPIDTVYVSAATGSPGNPGTRALPVRSIADAISIAQSADCEPVILAATGTYIESPAFVSGIRYYGGFDEATWTKTPGARSIFNVGITPATVEPYAFGVTVNGFEFRAEMPSTPGASSIAFRAVQVGNGVQFHDCVFQASRGTPGAPGANGGNGGAGAPGGAGGAGSVDCLLGCSVSGGNGGWGGQGGSGATGPATYGAYGGNGATTGSGTPGNVIACGSGGAGGAAGAACPTVGSLGTSGGAATGTGCAGSHGLNGGATPPGGYPSGIDGSVWAPNQGLTGAPGTAGGGGAGGGGGGSGTFAFLSTCYSGPGGAGGGGGGGGGAAWPGEGGGGGGSSFAVYLYDSSPGFTDCQFIAALGGDGGAGGDGGSGGDGGVGGFGGLGAGNGAGGGQGGTGGAGGHAGGGSGGAGGLSYCLLRWGTSSPLITNPSYIPGSGGSGGAGGRRGGPTGLFAPAGPAGTAGTIWP